MASKSDKVKKVSEKIISDTNKTAKKESSKPAKKDEDDENELEDDIEETSPKQKAGKASSKKGKEEDDDEEDEADDKEDDWEKVEAEEEWDPDFAEFDVPKSKGKKAVTPVKKGGADEDDFKVDDEFKDMFNDGDELNDEEDDY